MANVNCRCEITLVPERWPPHSGGMSSRTARAIAKPEEERRLEIFEKPGHLIRRLHQISNSVFIEQAKAYDLTPAQFASLLAVEFTPGIDQASLGRTVALDRTTVSVVVGRLVAKGLIERKRGSGRKVALALTGTARAMIEVMRPRIECVDDILLAPLNAAERDIFMRLLFKLVDVNNELSRAPHDAR
jgi:DNA-binding MarR family transcriptional regulator